MVLLKWQEEKKLPNKRDLKLKEYEISKHRYRELMNWCLQYDEWKRKVSSCYSLNSSLSRGMNGSGKSDPTASAAIRAEKYNSNIKLMETAAFEVDPVIGKYIIKNVAQGLPYEYLGAVPCGRRQFYEYRRKFFFLLDLKKN